MRKKTVRMVLSWLVLMSTSLGLPSEHVCKERWLGGGPYQGLYYLGIRMVLLAKRADETVIYAGFEIFTLVCAHGELFIS